MSATTPDRAADDAARAAAGPCGCEEALARLFEYLDAELPEPDCLRLAAHLAICDHCLDAASAEKHLRALLRRSCVERAPEELRVRVVTQLTVLRVQTRPSLP